MYIEVLKGLMFVKYLCRRCIYINIVIKVFKNVKIKKIIGLYYNLKVIKDLL